jgi:hypothetical protein
MQLGQPSFSDRSPRCPRCPRAKAVRMHRHGSYRRKRCGGAPVERFCCPICRLSCTVLPSGLLPYRSSPVQELEQHLDQRLAAEPAESAVQRPRVLERALSDFAKRRQALCELLGQLVSPAQASLPQLWRHLRKTLGSLEAILGLLHDRFGTSLLSDYRCLKAAPA